MTSANTNRHIAYKFIAASLLFAYPICVHLSVLLNTPLLQAVALSCLACGIAMLTKIKIWAALLLCLIIAVFFALAYLNAAIFLLYIPPIAIPIFLLIGFGSSLLTGREPLVTAIGEASRGPLSLEMREYTKRITQLWALLLGLIATANLTLAIIGNALLWSTMTSFGNYCLIGFVFISEFNYRKMRFKDHDHPSFFDYIKIVATSHVDTKQPRTFNHSLSTESASRH